MKRDTKQEILVTAKKLFNERGFNSVSINDIASTLGISKGNLTYYFKKKEEIVEALLEENSGIRRPDAPQTLAELDAFFLDIQQTVENNAYYFWHHAQLSQLSPKIRQQQNQVYQENVNKLMEAFHTLKAKSLFQDECISGQYAQIIDSLLLSSIYWMPFCTLRQGPASKVSFHQHAWTLLYPILTENGRKQLRKIILL